MRKLLLLAVLLLTANYAWTANVNESSARDRAQRFLVDRCAAGKMAAPEQGSLKLAHVEWNSSDKSIPVYYIFNANNAFVIVAGEDRAQTILAYGDRNLDIDHLPGNMKYWLSLYKRQLEFLQADPTLEVSLQSPLRAGQSVLPLLTAEWGQGLPYWNECPVFGGDTCYTGCPATSLSMVFHYWKYPRQQTMAVPSYMMSTYGVTLPELPPTVFDWDNMLDRYTDGNYTDVQATAVAHLLRYIGQAEEMNYSISASGAYGNDILRAVKFFEYDQNAQLLFKTDDLGYANYSDAQWASLIQNELVGGRPIVYCAYDDYTMAGHAFNVDGYDATNDTYHINWGWDGRGNGFYALNAFSYQDYAFGTAHHMVIGIQPPDGNQRPRLQAYPTHLDMEGFVNRTTTATISFKGTNLTSDVMLTLDDADGVFAIDGTSLNQAQAEAGTDITVTYSPMDVGTSSATITCSADGADPLTIVIDGAAFLECYPPVLLPANESQTSLTSFRAAWSDETPAANVTSYTLEVYSRPDYILLEEADFSDLPEVIPTNQASHATDYLPEGWTFTGSEFNLEGGCIMPRQNSVITTDALNLRGYDKVTVEVTAKSYDPFGLMSELTVSTSLASELLAFPFDYSPISVVLDCAEGDRIDFKAGYYPMIQAIKIYAGDATSSMSFNATESGNADYRLITGITNKYYTVRDLAAGGTFFYQVKAHYIDGSESDWSETRIVTLVDGGHPYSLGDVNHDGVLSIADVTLLISSVLSGGDICSICADVNGDNNISIGDVTRLIAMVLSGM